MEKKIKKSSFIQGVKIRRNLIIFLVLAIILLLSFFLRFYRLRDYIIFLGDQGRDVWVVKKMLIDGKFTLLGPVASVGGFYLGPLYYYLITPFLFLSKFDPIGPAILPALLGGITPLLLFFYVKKRYSTETALISAFLYTISPILVKYNRFSWNPNVIPFFSLIFFICFEKYLETKKNIFAVITGFLLGCLFQLHYLAFVFLPVMLIMLLIKFKFAIKEQSKSLLLLGIGGVIGWFPFILYEVRHNMQNFSGLEEFISRGGGTNVGFNAGQYVVSLFSNLSAVLYYLFNFPTAVVSIFLIGLLIYCIKTRSILSEFVIASFLMLSLYRGKMGGHYFNIVYVFVLIIISDILGKILKSKLKVIGIFFLLLISFFSIKAYPFWQSPNHQLDQTIEISSYVLTKYARSESFNFALVTNGNSDTAYRYFFDLWGNSPIEIVNDVIDPERKSVTNKLIVLCEPLSPCTDPRGAGLWEIASFGRAEIASQERFGVYTIYVLRHYIDKPKNNIQR